MKKFGFTLAEVLITLGIIGVVAALTAPALVMQSRNEANAARLAVAVSHLENAFTTAIATENVTGLSKTSFYVSSVGSETDEETGEKTEYLKEDNIKKFAGNLKKYLHLSDFSTETMKTFYGKYSKTPCFMDKNGAKGIVARRQEAYFPVMLKNGAIAFFQLNIVKKAADGGTKLTNQQIRDMGGGLYKGVGFCVIDVNGINEPNIAGRDMFMFMIGDNGILYPYGGTDVSLYTSGTTSHRWDQSGSHMICTDSDKSGSPGCTARVIEEGWKINY